MAENDPWSKLHFKRLQSSKLRLSEAADDTPDGRRQGDKQNPREAEVIVGEIRKIVEDPALARIEAQDRWRTIGPIYVLTFSGEF